MRELCNPVIDHKREICCLRFIGSWWCFYDTFAFNPWQDGGCWLSKLTKSWVHIQFWQETERHAKWCKEIAENPIVNKQQRKSWTFLGGRETRRSSGCLLLELSWLLHLEWSTITCIYLAMSYLFGTNDTRTHLSHIHADIYCHSSVKLWWGWRSWWWSWGLSLALYASRGHSYGNTKVQKQPPQQNKFSWAADEEQPTCFLWNGWWRICALVEQPWFTWLYVTLG